PVGPVGPVRSGICTRETLRSRFLQALPGRSRTAPLGVAHRMSARPDRAFDTATNAATITTPTRDTFRDGPRTVPVACGATLIDVIVRTLTWTRPRRISHVLSSCQAEVGARIASCEVNLARETAVR